MTAASEYRYNRLTWDEMNEAIALQKLVILPTGSTEQHGPVSWAHFVQQASFFASSVAAVGATALARTTVARLEEGHLDQLAALLIAGYGYSGADAEAWRIFAQYGYAACSGELRPSSGTD